MLSLSLLFFPIRKLSTFETMGIGAKICCQLFKWITSIVEISARQQEFLNLIASSFPDWLPKLYELQRTSRLCEFELELNRKCVDVVVEFMNINSNDEILFSAIEKELLLVKRNVIDSKGRLKDALVEIDKLKSDQAAREVYALEAMVEKCNSAKEEKDELLHLFQQNLTLSKQGDRGATESLAELRHQISNQQLKVSELDSQKKILEMQVEGNRLKRTNPARLPSDVTAKAVLAGEAKAGYVLAIGHAKAMLHSSGVKHASDLPVHLLDIYDTLAAKEFAARTEARKLFLEADEDRKMYDDYLQRLLTEAEMKEQKSKDRFTPTDKELEEERIEDDREAVYERLKHRQYIPDHAINSFPLQRRPIIVALARDVPAYTKDKIFNYITTNMPGRYITVDNESNCGFNVESMQAVLDANKNIILHVDHGLTRLSRDTFLKNFEITMQALIPQPAIVLVIGNESNRRGLEVHYGAGKRDVQLMKDGDIKSGLETVAWIVSEFRKHEIRSLMQKTSRLVFPPSEVFAFVLQAFFMVVSSDDNENDEYSLPDETLAGVAWRATRKILLESWHIIERIEAIKRGRSTSRQRACISKFIHSPIWPVKYSIERASDIVLNLLALFVEEFLKIETITNERGGTPLQALTKTSIKGFQAVLVATDGVNTKDTLTCSEGQNFKVFRECGWRVICAKTLKSILQDRRVSKLVTKLDNGGHYHVNVYRDEFNIYFEAYDPTTSETFMTKVSVGEVPSLLIPNANDRENNINTIPPQSPKEMYEQLLKLLRFDKESKKVEERKTLTCRRDSIFLMNATRKINGYFVLLKCYEAALGELFFSAYIPEFSASIKLTVNDTIRKGILDNVDCGGLTKESENSNSQDPKPLLPFIIDRLQMTPSSSILRAKGLVRHSRKASPKSSISQGFSMKARVHGGVGRILLRRLIRFYDVLHLIELRLSTPQKVLIIRVYEPVQQHTMTLQLSAYHRLLLLGNLSENHLDWYDKLLKRLRVNWRGSHSLRLDYSLFTTVLRINGKRLVAKIILVDELHIQVVLTELASSIKYYCTMNQQEVMLLLLYKPPLVAIQEDLGLNKLPKSIDKTIVESIQPEYNAPPIALSAEEENARFLSLLRDKNVLRNLASLLQSTLKPMYDGDAVRSYISYQGPLQAHFTMNFSKVSKVEDNSVVNEAEEGTNDGEVEDDKLQTAIRYESCMKQRVRDGTINSLLITRKQMPIVNMDSALNHMVRERANKSEVQRRLAILAGLSVEKHLDTLFTDAEKDQAIDRATRSVIEDILNEMQDKVMIRARQREVPVIIPPENYDELEGEEEDRMRRLAQDLAEVTSITDPDKMLVGKQEKLIFDGGIKTNYRDGKVRWHGHVSVKVYETPCWMGEDGQGNQYKFVVYEPNVASYFEGHIKSMKHLKEILGVAGQDLLDKKKSKEMAMFICKHRLDVVLNNKTWDGVEVEEGEPHYRYYYLLIS